MTARNPRSRNRLVYLLIAILVVGGIVAAWLLKVWPSQAALFPAGSRVLLVTLDTLRPDAVGFVSGNNETPNIDALAAAGVRFSGALAPVPLTLPSHISIMSGLDPIRHGVHVNGQALGAAVPLLAEQFKLNGYSTAAFVSSTVLKRDFGLARGFDTYDDDGDGDVEQLLQRRATQTVAAARQWIEQHDDGPWFVWVHLYDAHWPYDPPRVFWKPGARGPYDGTVTYMDDALKGLFDVARASSTDQLLTILTADHGEAFGEHGEVQHGIFIYDTTMRVPLVINYDGVLTPSAPAFVPRLVDLAPTIIDGMGWKTPIPLDGISLIPGLRGDRLDIPATYQESEFPWTSYGWAPLHGVHDGDWKFIAAPNSELFNLEKDPGEETNLMAVEPDQANGLIASLDRMRLASPIAAAVKIDDAETMARLRSLGYVGAGDTVGPAPDGRPDPKTKIDIRKRIHEADVAISRDGKSAATLRLYLEILRDDSENRYVLLKAVMMALELGEIEVAVDMLPRVLPQLAQQSDMQFALADALTRAKQYSLAIPIWMEVVRLQPARLDAWANLGSTTMWAGDPERAVLAYEEALRIDPDNAAILGNLGEVERSLRRNDAALVHLVAAATAEGSATLRSSRVGLLLSDMQRWEDAAPWFERARPTDDEYVAGQIRWASYLLESDPEAAGHTVQARCATSPQLVEAVHATAQLAAVASRCRIVEVQVDGQGER